MTYRGQEATRLSERRSPRDIQSSEGYDAAGLVRDGEDGKLSGRQYVDILTHVLGLHQCHRAGKYAFLPYIILSVHHVCVLGLPALGAFEMHTLQPHRVLCEVLDVDLEEYLLTFRTR